KKEIKKKKRDGRARNKPKSDAKRKVKDATKHDRDLLRKHPTKTLCVGSVAGCLRKLGHGGDVNIMHRQLRAAVELLNLLQVYAYWACAIYISAILDGCSIASGSPSPEPPASLSASSASPASSAPIASSESFASSASSESAAAAISALLSAANATAEPASSPQAASSVASWIPSNAADRQRLLDEIVDSKDFIYALASRLYYGSIKQNEEEEFSTPQRA
ncbi:hypothetical protein BGZ75_002352, partial [Mortierella antarctica]